MAIGSQNFREITTRILQSRLVQNIGALAGLQTAGYFITLLTLPYLTRVLGPDEWGRVVWMQVILSAYP